MRRPLSQMSTMVLTNRHEAHDLAIANKDDHVLDETYSSAAAKQVKLAVKLELSRRATAGDAEAVAYATRRAWPGFVTSKVMVAAE